VHFQLVSEAGNFNRSLVPLMESLKSKAHPITDARKQKNLTHLQRVLLFKDSRAPCKRGAPSHSGGPPRGPP
jgi:hypothetical protein